MCTADIISDEAYTENMLFATVGSSCRLNYSWKRENKKPTKREPIKIINGVLTGLWKSLDDSNAERGMWRFFTELYATGKHKNQANNSVQSPGRLYLVGTIDAGSF